MQTNSSKTKSMAIIPIEIIERRIYLIRGQKVMLDADLADLYGVTTKVLNQTVRRNTTRFPSDFSFKLSQTEKDEVVTNCDHLSRLKYSHQMPYAFTEHGIAMLSAVLKSPRAIAVSVYIVRAFIKLREMLATHKDLAKKMEELEQRQENQGKQLTKVFQVLKHLLEEPIPKKEPIGFRKN